MDGNPMGCSDPTHLEKWRLSPQINTLKTHLCWLHLASSVLAPSSQKATLSTITPFKKKRKSHEAWERRRVRYRYCSNISCMGLTPKYKNIPMPEYIFFNKQSPIFIYRSTIFIYKSVTIIYWLHNSMNTSQIQTILNLSGNFLQN